MGPMTSRMLRALAAGVVLVAATFGSTSTDAQPVAAPSPLDRWQSFIAEASGRFGIPEGWIRAVMEVESGGQILIDGRPITSRVGAMGLMQVMPETYAELRGRYGLGADAYDAHDNILAGTAYLRELYQRYG